MLQNRKRIDSSVELGEEVADFEWTEQNYDSKIIYIGLEYLKTEQRIFLLLNI